MKSSNFKLLPLPFCLTVAVHGGWANAADGFGEPRFNWSNSFQYSSMYRLQDQDANLLQNSANSKSANIDDGNSNFNKGIVSNRLELLSELDVVYENGWGARASGMAWFDQAYDGRNDNPGISGGAVPNQSGEANEFTDATINLHGHDTELRDAFLFGRSEIGETVLRFRVGQYASLWGESLFFADNGIAGAQNAFDIDRLLRDPTAEAKEFVLPVPQIGADWQINTDVTVSGYYQLGFQANRLPAVGSYMSTQDTGVEGAQNMWIGNGTSIPLSETQEADDDGQFGLQLRWRLDDTDLGFYLVRFHDKNYQQVVNVGVNGPLTPITSYPGPESYSLKYHQGTTAYGMSASHSFGNMNLAIEGSIRQNQALVSSGANDLSGIPYAGFNSTDNDSNPAYAVGKTAHINLSTISLLNPNAFFQEASLLGEIAWNRLLSCEKSCSALDPNATRDAVSFRVVFEPVYRQVISGLDLGIPIGVGYTPKGSRSSVSLSYPPEAGGDFTIGLNGTYLNTWQASLAYTNFFGESDGFITDRQDPSDTSPAFSYKQSRKDRDFISMTLSRRF